MSFDWKNLGEKIKSFFNFLFLLIKKFFSWIIPVLISAFFTTVKTIKFWLQRKTEERETTQEAKSEDFETVSTSQETDSSSTVE